MAEHYTKREEMVPMRDGVRLHTAIYEPVAEAFAKDADPSEWDGAEPRPILMTRTPFSLKPYGKGFRKHIKDDQRNFVRAGYIIVYQSVRGRYLSEGEFVNVRPVGGSVDETTDTSDTCDWLLSHTSNNGRIGVRGMSYPGFYATMAAISGHPAIRAVSPQAPVTDWYMGDDAHHNGALMLADMHSFGAKFFRSRKSPSIRTLPAVTKVEGDIYEHFLGKGTIRKMLEPFDSRTPFWEDLRSHKDYDGFWKERAATRHLRDIKPAMLFVGGTYDAEDAYGPVACWRSMRNQSPETEAHLVLGPWCHGGWLFDDYDHLDGAWFGTCLSDTFLDTIEWPFFRRHLEGKGEGLKSAVLTIPSFAKRYVPGGKRNFFPPVRRHDVWPPEGTVAAKLHLEQGGTLSCTRPSSGKETFASDPSDPVPYRADSSAWRNPAYMAADQRFLSHRSDVLSFWSAPLRKTMRLAGPLRATISVETDATDLDVIVKLVDVRPDGYQMLVRGDVMPARYRDGFEHPKPTRPGEPMTLDFTMTDIVHDVLPGHRLMVQVQASCFPLIAMNPQHFVENQYEAEEYRTAKVTVLCGESCLGLPLSGGSSGGDLIAYF